jgi:hypothetical protein
MTSIFKQVGVSHLKLTSFRYRYPSKNLQNRDENATPDMTSQSCAVAGAGS